MGLQMTQVAVEGIFLQEDGAKSSRVFGKEL